MKDLSVIIVNYNVQYFLDQCLQSVFESKHNLDLEVFVVDNASVDGSVNMVKEKYPQCHLIANDENLGFSVANNLAIRKSNSTYTLLLNPDTILSEDCLQKCFDQMQAHQDIGALGVKMMDGKGSFLPESKRGLPTLWTAFSKMAGLSALFPKSESFNKYHLGHLDKEKNHEVDVLSGAFMFMRTETLDKTGLLDEQFFMYGEDIDLSYRIQQSGYKNFYFAETEIIHFKGESTKKSSLSYTRNFYNAMIIFNKKHFSGNSGLVNILVTLAIMASGFFAFLKRHLLPLVFPVVNALLIFGIFLLVKEFWATYYFQNANYYKDIPVIPLFAGSALVYSFVLFLVGYYDEDSKFADYLKAWGLGALIMLIAYSFLPESYRFSRAIVFISISLIFLVLWLTRKIYNKISKGNWNFDTLKNRGVVIIGSSESAMSIKSQLMAFNPQTKFKGAISPNETIDPKVHVASVDKIQEIVKMEQPHEIIFCSKDMSNAQMFGIMQKLGNKYNYRRSAFDESSIIGSDSKNAMGNWFSSNLNFALALPKMKRQKRFFDFVFSILLLLIIPMVLVLSRSRWKVLKNIFPVLTGSKTWVAYIDNQVNSELPKIKSGVFTHLAEEVSSFGKADHDLLDQEYAKSYTIWKDFLALVYNLMP